MKKTFILLSIFFLLAASVYGQKKEYEVYAIAFYNLENLFDTIDDVDNNGDNEFLPEGVYKWTKEKYEKKLDNIAKVISRLGKQYCPYGAAAIGVAEVENRKVLEDLVQRPAIAEMGLQIIHKDSPDRRGIDVALLYNPKLFSVTGYSTHRFQYADTTYVTRDQLLVNGLLAGEPIHLLVNHWPSRYGNKSSALREAAATVANSVIDSLRDTDSNAKIILMGDLNDDPVNKSCREVLNAQKKKRKVKTNGLYNPMWRLFDQGIGSLAYQGKWSLFDQMIVSKSLINEKQKINNLRFWKVKVFGKDFLVQKEGKHKGYPLRTFSNNTFINGYSDHFPVITYLIREKTY